MVVPARMGFRGRGGAVILLLALTLCSRSALASKKGARTVSADVKEDVAGPVVRHAAPAPPPEGGNATGADAKKKSIAQIIDEALEQEFPEEKPEKIGKNYNETALQEDVRAGAAGRSTVCLLRACLRTPAWVALCQKLCAGLLAG